MAVLIECLNVVVPAAVLNRKFPGGVEAYAARCPNATYVSDGLLTRVGFMAPRDVQLFTGALELLGLTYLDESGSAVDFVVVDHREGPTTACDWVGFSTQPHLYAAAAWLKSAGEPTSIYAPPEWRPDPARWQTMPVEPPYGMDYVGVNDKVDVFMNEAGEPRYIGRPFADGEPPFADLMD
ncbi:MAG TPA: hypothetical protein VFY90_06115 [Tepidiformaceae bacterium]|nr:hypothetical protein [Tepidiformaceae bacterium]